MPKVIIVGAGITGLSAARVLADAGWHVHILDKESQLGGRFTTLHFGDMARTIDNGAQFLTTRHSRFAEAVAEWVNKGWVKPWCHGIPILTTAGINNQQDGYPRYIGRYGMHMFASHLASDFNIQLQTTVTHIAKIKNSWNVAYELIGENNRATKEMDADALIVTQPAPVVIPLLTASQIPVPDALLPIRYAPCFSLAIDFPEQITPLLPPPGAVRIDDPASPLMWIASAHGRGLTQSGDALVLHAGEVWSTTHLTHSTDDKATLLINDSHKTLARLGITPDILSLAHIGQQWVHSRCVVPSAHPFVRLPTHAPLLIAGDGFGDCPRVEGAWVSGYEAATALRDEWST